MTQMSQVTPPVMGMGFRSVLRSLHIDAHNISVLRWIPHSQQYSLILYFHFYFARGLHVVAPVVNLIESRSVDLWFPEDYCYYHKCKNHVTTIKKQIHFRFSQNESVKSSYCAWFLKGDLPRFSKFCCASMLQCRHLTIASIDCGGIAAIPKRWL